MQDLMILKSTQLENGWDQLLLKETVASNDGSFFLRDYKFLTSSRLRSELFTFSTKGRNDFIDSLIKNLNRWRYGYTKWTFPTAWARLQCIIWFFNALPFHNYTRNGIWSFFMEYYEPANLLSTNNQEDSLLSVLKLEQTLS